MQFVPMVHHHLPTLVCRPRKPATDRIFIDLDNPRSAADRISFRQRTDREVENGRISIQIEVGRAIGQGDSPATGAAPRLRMAMTAAILDQQRLPERHAVVATVPIRAVQCFPVHCILDQ
jgi:hypothetical protein